MLASLAANPACRSTSTNVTGPSSAKCAISLSGTGLNVPAGGGTGAISVGINRECSWSASSQAAWITLTGTTSGQGPGTISFAASANAGSAARTGGVLVGQQRVEVQQQGAPCTASIEPASPSVGSAAAQVRMAVTIPGGCAWTAQSSVPWATIAEGASGSGDGSVLVSVGANTGPPRSATLTIAGQAITLSQAGAQACTYAVSLTTSSFPAAGGTAVATIVTPASCQWAVASGAPWLTLPGADRGSGNADVPFNVAANAGAARTTTLTVANQTFTISQLTGQVSCSYTVSPRSRSVPAGGGSDEFDVATTSSCDWTASSNASWITITGGASGSGSGRVRFLAAANTGAARSGTISIAGELVTVEQAALACSYSVTPATLTVGASGGQGSVTITAPAACPWTATSNVSWITVTGGAGGTGDATVSFNVSANGGDARAGTLTVAGQTVTVRQDAVPCTFVVAPTTASAPSGGGDLSFDVTTAASCVWTAVSNVPWLTISAGASGSGNGRVTVSAQANTAVQPRTGTATIAGQTVTVTQAAAACAYSVAPSSVGIPATGGTGTFTVTTAGGCAWTAIINNADWLTITSGTTGIGSGSVAFSAATNTSGSARSGTLTVAGQTVTVNQQ